MEEMNLVFEKLYKFTMAPSHHGCHVGVLKETDLFL